MHFETALLSVCPASRAQGLMQEQISQQNHDDLGCDGWEISAHGGSAPDHEPIQGRQYPDAEFRRLNNSLQRRIGTLNCGHSAMPIIMGVNSPQYTDEELGDTEKLQQDQIQLQILKQRYHEFSKAAGLPEQYERLEKAGFTWKHGKAAERAFESMSASTKEISGIFRAGSSKELQKAVDRSIIELRCGFACFPDGDPLNDNSKNVEPLDGFFDVALHGSPRNVFFRSKSENKMSARTLATVIRHSKGYVGQNIRLLSCNTGKTIGDSYCFAEELSNALGVTVTAPNKALYIFQDGTLRVGRSGDGVFMSYKPNQRRRLK